MVRDISVLSIILCSWLPAATATARTAGTEGYGGLAPQVVEAWEKAGGAFKWMTPPLYDPSSAPDEPPVTAAVPGFHFSKFPPPGGLKKLPAPNVPFGLSLTYASLTQADLKDLAALKQLRLLGLIQTNITEGRQPAMGVP